MPSDALQNPRGLLQLVARIQAEFILSGQTRESFDPLLSALLELTESEYGFIGEVLRDGMGAPYLKTHALTNISWNEETSRFYEENAPNGLEFRNLETLFGRCMSTGEPVLADDPAGDPRRGGLPPGHPPLLKFAGLPIYQGDEMVGMIGLANRPGGYNEELVESLQPVLATCATLIVGFRTVTSEREEQRLRHDQERTTTAIVNTAVDAIIMIDEDGTIVTFNQGAERIFGWQAEEVLGSNVRRLMPGSDRSRHDNYLSRYLKTGRSGIIGTGREIEAQRRDGETFPAELSISEVKLDDRRQFVGILRDISERRLAEDQLREAKQAAEAASRAKSFFLATMSHEIRTPLNAILGMTELLGDTALDEEQRELVRTLSVSGESLLQLISDFLDLSKVEAGQLEIVETDFDLRDLIDDALVVVRPRAQAKDIELESRVSPVLPRFLRGDLNRIRQVLLNLLGNAIKFTDGGGVRLEVTVEPHGNSHQENVVFRVADDGVGITGKDHLRIFDKFFQASPQDSAHRGGSGLGLTICQELARKMGGDIILEASAPGRGSTFRLTLPMVEAERLTSNVGEVMADAEMPASGAQAGAGRPAGSRVLLAEDNEENRRITQRQLEKLGCVVENAADGEQAAALARAKIYDAILMDLDMPVCDGIEATSRIRDHEAKYGLAAVPIIALTAHALEEYRQRALAAGVNDYVTKPVRRKNLAQVLWRWIDRRPAVLVVDDNPDARMLTAAMLERAKHFRVESVDGGEKAIEALDRQAYAAVVLDLEMPGMNGVETARQIRLRHDPGPAIVALSGHSGGEHERRSREAGCDAYFTKPVDRRLLAETLERLLAEPGTVAGPAAE